MNMTTWDYKRAIPLVYDEIGRANIEKLGRKPPGSDNHWTITSVGREEVFARVCRHLPEEAMICLPSMDEVIIAYQNYRKTTRKSARRAGYYDTVFK